MRILYTSTRRIQAQAAIYTETGDPQKVIKVISHKVPDTADELQRNEVLIRMLAAPVNPSDLNQIEGSYPVKARFKKLNAVDGTNTSLIATVGGNEGVAEILATGSSVAGLYNGDWVVPRQAGVFGTWCTHAVVKDKTILKIPSGWREGVEAIDVACLKVNPSTAYRLLSDFVDLRPGDCIIQNGANSGVGRAVIQLAKHWGIRTINIVRDRPHLPELAQELYNLGADVVISDKQLIDTGDGRIKIKEQIKSLKAPICLGLNCVGGRTTVQMTKLISQGGVLVSYGGMSRQPVMLPTSLLIFKDISARGFWMNRWYSDCTLFNKKEDEIRNMWRNILKLTADHHFTTQPLQHKYWRDLSTEQSTSLVKEAVSWDAGIKQAFVFV
ncbi:NAD(P)-binding protein [Coemansia reversa NRRL 1564]|uniref:enoyl-[acyl-carrier-protein] reductase n=1 Tax=Coemansia reversa (strain ATCC 12441 / NRRL 1564) TaxID=763665 RepID=A0A2G5BAX9_COERN|nr:NAD(P)-binding protein [Coemansia reversa NRRL 1564]|eukprot:PIA16169.1 NAD(P)-binding protein [Coemansia reversa NRRL 1564]